MAEITCFYVVFKFVSKNVEWHTLLTPLENGCLDSRHMDKSQNTDPRVHWATVFPNDTPDKPKLPFIQTTNRLKHVEWNIILLLITQELLEN